MYVRRELNDVGSFCRSNGGDFAAFALMLHLAERVQPTGTVVPFIALSVIGPVTDLGFLRSIGSASDASGGGGFVPS